MKDIDAPKLKKELPRYLTLEQSKNLLSAVDGKNQERDYAILTLFLNCGLRISELVGLNLQDIQDETMRILGKGNKVRILYLNDACQAALNRYLAVRRPITGRDGAESRPAYALRCIPACPPGLQALPRPCRGRGW